MSRQTGARRLLHHGWLVSTTVIATLWGGIGSAAEPPTDPFHGPPAASTAAAAPPPEAKVVPLIHADATELAELLRAGGALSEQGRTNPDPRTNSLLLYDTPPRIAAIESIIAQLDRETEQVMIEARIVLAAGDYALEIGSRLGLGASSDDDQLLLSSGDLLTGSGDGLFADLPSIDGGGRLALSVGKISDHLLELELSAMEAEGRGQLVSSPRVVTAERREARIEQGVQIPYQQSSEEGGTTIAFRDATLSLTATPAVNDDGTVSLDLHVTKDAVGQVYAGVPSIDTQAVSTHLRVPDGETVVLGGVHEQEHRELHRGVPWLSRIPILGALFRHRSESSRHQELMIFVTPRIVDPQEGGE